MSKYTKLIKNSGIFAIASIGSHFISFIFVRFYTELLTTEQYGIIDVMVTTTSFIIPVFSLAIVEAVLRFSIDEGRPKDVFANGLVVATTGSIVFSIVGPFVLSKTIYKDYVFYMAIFVFLTSVDNICAQHVRGIGKISIFAFAGIIKTAVLAGSNIFFLWGLGWKIEGYMLSMILSELASILFLMISSKAYQGLSFRFNKPLLSQMMKYSIPLIPNSLSWWIVNAADKYTIFLTLGTSSNGLYAVAHKLPSFINVCNNLFFQAWQLSAVEESKNEKKSEFYSNVFNMLALILFMVAAILLILLRPIMKLLAASEYGEAWRYTPFLIIGMIFSAFSSFLGTNYVAMKNTNGSSKTTIVGAVVNIILNFAFIKAIGMNGAALATMLSYAIIWIFRIIDTRKFINIAYRKVALTLSICILVSQSLAVILNWKYSSITGFIACVAIAILYRNEVSIMTSMVKRTLSQGKA